MRVYPNRIRYLLGQVLLENNKNQEARKLFDEYIKYDGIDISSSQVGVIYLNKFGATNKEYRDIAKTYFLRTAYY